MLKYLINYILVWFDTVLLYLISMFLVLVYCVGMFYFVTVKDIRVYFVAKINMKFIK